MELLPSLAGLCCTVDVERTRVGIRKKPGLIADDGEAGAEKRARAPVQSYVVVGLQSTF